MTTNLNINGTERPFCVGMGALIEFERITGKNFLKIVGDDGPGLSMSDIASLAYCSFLVGARSHKQNFEFEQYEVIDWIDQHIGFPVITRLITEGLGKLGMAEQQKKKASGRTVRLPK